MISLLLWATLFLGMTHNKYAKYNFIIHQIDVCGNVLKELMSLSLFNFQLRMACRDLVDVF